MSKKPRTLVLFFMSTCGHCAANKPAWDDACKQMKEEDPDINIEEHESREDDVMKSEGIESFPTMKLKEGDAEGVLVGKQDSGKEIVDKLEKDLKKKKGGSRKRKGGRRSTRRLTHRRSRKLRRGTLRNYVGLR